MNVTLSQVSEQSLPTDITDLPMPPVELSVTELAYVGGGMANVSFV